MDVEFEEEFQDEEASKDKIKKLRKKLSECEKEKKEYLSGWQRAKADIINFKRESREKQASLAKFAVEDLIRDTLPVLDSFKLAIAHGADEGTENVYKQLWGILRASGVEEVSVKKGDVFDPGLHDPIDNVPVENEKDAGKIMEVVQTGYTLHGKELRAPRVRVGSHNKNK